MKKDPSRASRPFDEALLVAQVAELLDHIPTFQSVYGLDNADLKALYALAYDLYCTSRYADAQKLFGFLCFNNHYEKKYWLGLGAARYKLRRYAAAAQAYSYASMLDTEDADAVLYATAYLLNPSAKQEKDAGSKGAAQAQPSPAKPCAARGKKHRVLSLRQKAMLVLKALGPVK